MTPEQAKQFVLNLYRDIWQGKDLEKLSHYYHPEVEGRADEQTLRYEDIKKYARYQHENFTNIEFKFHDIISEETAIAMRFNSSRVGKDGTKINYNIVGFYHLKDEKVYRVWAITEPYINFKPQQ